MIFGEERFISDLRVYLDWDNVEKNIGLGC